MRAVAATVVFHDLGGNPLIDRIEEIDFVKLASGQDDIDVEGASDDRGE